MKNGKTSEMGDIRLKKGYHQGRRHKIQDMQVFKAFIDNNHDKTLKELAGISSKHSATTTG